MKQTIPQRAATQGFALISVMLAMTVLAAIAAIYVSITVNHLRDTRNVSRSVSGFYAAEGGLNYRAEQVRSKFVDYNRPAGSGPAAASPCVGSNQGSGDLACDAGLVLGGRTVKTYVLDTTGSTPTTGIVNPGEAYAGLTYQQYAYRVVSEAYNDAQSSAEARLQMEFQSRLVPLFQFAAFYNNDLEINPSPPMTLNGRVHTNGNLYLSPAATLTIGGRVTAGKTIWRGRKDTSSCNGGGVNITDTDANTTTKTLQGCSGGTMAVTEANLNPFNGRVKVNVPTLTVPPLSSLDPQPSNELFSKADLRIKARLIGNTWVPTVYSAAGMPLFALTALSDPSCKVAVTMNPPTNLLQGTFKDKRANAYQTLIEVDQEKLMTCLHRAPAGTFRNEDGSVLTLDDTTGGGLVWNFSFDNGNPALNTTTTPPVRTATNYGVRLRNAARLGSAATGAPAIKGLTIASNQAVYLQGDVNKDDGAGFWKPASILADSINVLSNSWSDVNTTGVPPASSTEVNAAFMAGTDITGAPGYGYNGGLENYPRFHENWTGNVFRYRGSFVSLGVPVHATGKWGGGYNPPQRDWDYDVRFNDAANLPPLAPRFVYLRQLLFGRGY